MVSKQKCNGKTKRRTTDQSEILIGKITSQTVHINHNYGSWLPLRDWWIEQLYKSNLLTVGSNIFNQQLFLGYGSFKRTTMFVRAHDVCISACVKTYLCKTCRNACNKSLSTMDKSCQSWVARCWPAIVVQALVQIAIMDPTVQWKAIHAPVRMFGKKPGLHCKFVYGYLGIM
jgi:hypothetical protein